MPAKRLFTALLIGLGLTLAVMTGLSLAPVERAHAQGTIYYVDDDVCPATGSGTEGDPYCRIQDAVDVANAGEEVRVVGGTYTGTQTVADSRTGYTYTQVVFIPKSLILRGGYDSGDWNADPDPVANPTVIDAQRQGRGVSIVGASGDLPAVTVDGFTITGGDYTGLGNPAGAVAQVCHKSGGWDCGGGLYARLSGLTLRNSVITDNVASRNNGDGGGIYLWAISPSGSSLASGIENTIVISNSGDYGGGMSVVEVYDPITITQSTFQDNYADYGGGLDLATNIEALVTIVETDFISNTAETYGGGAYVRVAGDGETLRMERVWMTGNEVGMQGAAVYLGRAGVDFTPSARLTNLLLTGNRATSGNPTGAVIAIRRGYDFDVTLAHLTAAGNPAPTFLRAEAPNGGRFLTVTLTNTLVTSVINGFVGYQGNGDGSLLIRHTNTLTDDVATLHYTEAGSPIFQAVNPLAGDPRLDATYHLQPGSAAIDAGVDAGVTTDIDGQSRPQGLAPDIGADEFVPVPPGGVSISGPTEGIVGGSYVFVATPIPPTATQPISYTWSPTPTSGQGTDAATYIWTTPGTKTLTVLLENPIGTVLVPGAHTITIQDYRIYLPLVLRSQ